MHFFLIFSTSVSISAKRKHTLVIFHMISCPIWCSKTISFSSKLNHQAHTKFVKVTKRESRRNSLYIFIFAISISISFIQINTQQNNYKNKTKKKEREKERKKENEINNNNNKDKPLTRRRTLWHLLKRSQYKIKIERELHHSKKNYRHTC